MNCTLAVKAERSMVSQDPYFSMVPGVFGCNIGDVTRLSGVRSRLGDCNKNPPGPERNHLSPPSKEMKHEKA